ncbi:MAG: hypothetical protein C5B51_17530 [Terriglobia bacterium]|nr:MAG: hypothetical protein C5B51_17530 [Terriglobia bacterium]
MFARLTVSVCLLSVGAIAASSKRAFEGSNDIVVYLHHRMELPSIVSGAMWQETLSLMHLSGYHVRQLEAPHAVVAAFLVVVELEGPCDPEIRLELSTATRSLASTVIEHGRILPFIHVNCSLLQRFLASALGSKPDRQFVFGRALGRLLAHELYHVAGQTTSHDSTGVTEPAVWAQELISDQFPFGKAALEKLRAPAPYANQDSGSGFESGSR